MSLSSLKRRARFISKQELLSLKEGATVNVRYAENGTVVGLPYIREGFDPETNKRVNVYKVKVKFREGPWKGETLTLIRQQIEKIISNGTVL